MKSKFAHHYLTLTAILLITTLIVSCNSNESRTQNTEERLAKSGNFLLALATMCEGSDTQHYKAANKQICVSNILQCIGKNDTAFNDTAAFNYPTYKLLEFCLYNESTSK